MDLASINAVLRHQEQELRGLEKAMAQLSRTIFDLRTSESKQSDFLARIDSLSAVQQERDALFEKLRLIAASRPDDVCANLYLYLIDELREHEEAAARLEAEYIECRFGSACPVPLEVPGDLAKMSSMYERRKKELAIAEQSLRVTEAAHETAKWTLEECRSRIGQAVVSLPDRVWEFEQRLQKIEGEFRDRSQKNEREIQLLRNRQKNYEQRSALIQELADSLREVDFPQSQIFQGIAQIRQILMLVNREDGPDAVIAAHVLALLHIATAAYQQAPQTPPRRQNEDVKEILRRFGERTSPLGLRAMTPDDVQRGLAAQVRLRASPPQ
jgi:hypothetical protein